MEAVMCQGDTTVLTMIWSDGVRPIGNLPSPHECVNWDRLMEWVVPNSVNAFEDGMLVHPKYGKFIFYFSGCPTEHYFINFTFFTGPLIKDGQPSDAFIASLTSSGSGKVSTFDENVE